MNENIYELDDKFQEHLLKNDYTFIGPENLDLLSNFTEIANEIAPVKSIFRSAHDALSNRDATRTALKTLPLNTPLRIYVVTSNNSGFLIHGTIEEYCRKNNISFTI